MGEHEGWKRPMYLQPLADLRITLIGTLSVPCQSIV